jgi:hypothetical protein
MRHFRTEGVAEQEALDAPPSSKCAVFQFQLLNQNDEFNSCRQTSILNDSKQNARGLMPS